MNTHPGSDVQIDVTLIRRLLSEHPRLAAEPIEFASHGWDNEMWRIGADLAIRLPRRAVAADLLLNEIRYLPAISTTVDLAVPDIVVSGGPAYGYPYPWAVVRWNRGEPATTRTARERDDYADDLALFCRQRHQPAPADHPVNPFRGGSLRPRDGRVRERIAQHDGLTSLLPIWESGLQAPEYAGPPRWLHGDPHPYNCLVGESGELSAVIDFGDIAAGDPASDIAVAWLHFSAAGRETFRVAYDADDATWTRAAAWAVSYVSSFAGLDERHPLRSVAAHASAQLAETCS